MVLIVFNPKFINIKLIMYIDNIKKDISKGLKSIFLLIMINVFSKNTVNIYEKYIGLKLSLYFRNEFAIEIEFPKGGIKNKTVITFLYSIYLKPIVSSNISLGKRSQINTKDNDITNEIMLV